MGLQLWQIHSPHEVAESLRVCVHCPYNNWISTQPACSSSFFGQKVDWMLAGSNLILYIPVHLMSYHLPPQLIVALFILLYFLTTAVTYGGFVFLSVSPISAV